jgi:hypothetical protein
VEHATKKQAGQVLAARLPSGHARGRYLGGAAAICYKKSLLDACQVDNSDNSKPSQSLKDAKVAKTEPKTVLLKKSASMFEKG